MRFKSIQRAQRQKISRIVATKGSVACMSVPQPDRAQLGISAIQRSSDGLCYCIRRDRPDGVRDLMISYRVDGHTYFRRRQVLAGDSLSDAVVFQQLARSPNSARTLSTKEFRQLDKQSANLSRGLSTAIRLASERVFDVYRNAPAPSVHKVAPGFYACLNDLLMPKRKTPPASPRDVAKKVKTKKRGKPSSAANPTGNQNGNPETLMQIDDSQNAVQDATQDAETWESMFPQPQKLLTTQMLPIEEVAAGINPESVRASGRSRAETAAAIHANVRDLRQFDIAQTFKKPDPEASVAWISHVLNKTPWLLKDVPPCTKETIPVLTPDVVFRYLCEPWGGRRPCVMGKTGCCVGQTRLRHSGGPFALAEFLLPEQEAAFLASGDLPETHGMCILCSRFYTDMAQLEAKNCGHVIRRTCNSFMDATGAPGLYTKRACISPDPNNTNGIVGTVRRFRVDEYVEQDRTIVENGVEHTVRGFAEVESAFF